MSHESPSLTVEILDDTALRLERFFAATPDRVFRAFTDSSEVPQWMGAPGAPMSHCEIALKVGGAFRYEWTSDQGTMGLTGRYQVVDRPHRLEHTESFDEDWTGGETHVTTTFDARGTGTLVRMDIRYASTAARDAAAASPMKDGMEVGYRTLDDRLAGRTDWFEMDAERDLVLDRRVPVSPARVWEAWTDAALLVQWFTPPPWRTESAVIDPRPGGAFDTVMAGPNGESMASSGCVLEAIPQRLLVWTDALSAGFRPAGTGFMTAMLQLTPHADGTHYRVLVKHSGPEAREQHASMGFEHGWGTALDQLVALMRSTDAEQA